MVSTPWRCEPTSTPGGIRSNCSRIVTGCPRGGGRKRRAPCRSLVRAVASTLGQDVPEIGEIALPVGLVLGSLRVVGARLGPPVVHQRDPAATAVERRHGPGDQRLL